MKKLMLLVSVLGLASAVYAMNPIAEHMIMRESLKGLIKHEESKQTATQQKGLLPEHPELEGDSSEQATAVAKEQFEKGQQQLKSLAFIFPRYAAELEKIQELHGALFNGFNTSMPEASHWPEDEEWMVAFRVQGAGKALDESFSKIDSKTVVNMIKIALCHQYLVRGQLYFLPYALNMIDGNPHEKGVFLGEMYDKWVQYHKTTGKPDYRKR
ncbi:MAG: hypothetical protein IKN49_00660 [Elusimicrobiaceae bacterium]|nr:hypothetical protein [Elusimicrobiaceae bacterium]